MKTKSKAKAKPAGAIVADPQPAIEREPIPEGVEAIVPANKIVRSPWNRTHFPEATLAEMEGSIREHGILQPPCVRPVKEGEWFVEAVTRNGGKEPADHGWHFLARGYVEHLRTMKQHAPPHPLWSSFIPGFYATKEEAEAAMPTHELVYGERRWRGASRIRTDYPLPVIIRVLSDRQALELQKIENLQREDVDPIEEGRGLRQMLTEFGYSLEELMTKLQRGKSHIYARIKLGSLCDLAVAFFRKGAFSESVAIRIARLPNEELQHRFLAHCDLLENAPTGRITARTIQAVVDAWDPEKCETISDREAERIIAEHLMKELKGAPFDQADANLVPTGNRLDLDQPDGIGERFQGGACTDCPMRSGNQPDFDPARGRADVCLNPACYRLKAEAAFKLKAEKHQADGGTILPLLNGKRGKAAEAAEKQLLEVFGRNGDGVAYGADLQLGSETLFDYKTKGGKEAPTLAAVAKQLDIAPVLALHPRTDQVVKLYPWDTITKQGEAAGIIESRWGKATQVQRDKAAVETQKRERAVKAALMQQAVEAAPKAKTPDLLRFVLQHLVNDASADQARQIVRRRQIDLAPYKGKSNGIPQRAALDDLAEKFTGADVLQLLFELAITPRFEGYVGSGKSPLKQAFELFGLDYKAADQAARTAYSDAKKAKKSAKAAKKAKPGKKPKEQPAADPDADQMKPGALGDLITEWLQAKGGDGITVRELAEALQVPPADVTAWLGTEGKKTKEIRKLAPGKFGWVEVGK